MASRAIYGKPGGGKSQLAVKWLLEELASTKRCVITNVPLNLDAIVRYFATRAVEIDVYGRVRILDDDEVKDFWRFRGTDPARDHRLVSEKEIENGFQPAAEYWGDGVAYYLDELHRHLNSRQWKKTGPLILSYISMHRHFGDDVVWITQAVKNVDVQWRSVTQDYTKVRNYGKEMFRGFRKGDRFEWLEYLDWSESETFTPQRRGEWTLEKDVVACYQTSTVGGDADKEHRVKGLHIWWLYGAVAAALALVALAFVYVPGYLGRKMGEKSKASAETRSASREAITRGDLASVGVPVDRGAAVPRGGAPLDTIEIKEKEVLHVVAVPLMYATAADVLGGVAGKSGLPTIVSAVPNVNGTAVIVTATDLQNAITFAEGCRKVDVASASIVVRCVVGRRVKAAKNDVGLFAYLERAADRSQDNAASQLFSELAYDLATGVVTIGGSLSVRQALEIFTQFVSGDNSIEVMSQPTISVLSGKSAQFAAGREIPVPSTNVNLGNAQTSIDYKRAEFSIIVTPVLTSSGSVRLEVKQTNSDVLETVKIDGNQVPTLSTQSMMTTVDITGKQLYYVGGIDIQTQQSGNRGTPYLRDIPVLNTLFGRHTANREKEELFIVISAEVMKLGQSPVKSERPTSKKAKKRH